jgi:hypothetical protein
MALEVLLKNNYIKRLIEPSLKELLEDLGAVWVQGPKWTGKTSTCAQHAESMLNLRDPDVLIDSRQAASIRPSMLLKGASPRLIDEWQLLPVLWDSVISEVDKRSLPGQFLLTGSATSVNQEELLHTGTGRISRIKMLTMTLEETGESSCEVSISGLFDVATQLPSAKYTAEVEGISSLSIEDLATIVCRGGWPEVIARGATSNRAAKNYIEALYESDLGEAIEERIDPDRAHALLRSLARNTAQDVSNKTLIADVQNSGLGMSEPTLRKYLNAFRRLFVLDDIKAWAPGLRSKTPLRTSPVLHLCDPSLAAAALGTNARGLLDDLETFGFLFESLCVHDLRVYMSLLGGGVYRYRDKSGLEVDAILRLSDSRWAGVEVKLGGEQNIEAGAKHLLKLADKVDAAKSGAPQFLMVVTGGKYAYTRSDGVHVCPLGCLCH